MKVFVKCIAILGVLLSSIIVTRAQDSLFFEESDSIFFEERRNYLGVNLSPLFTSSFGRENRNAKMSVVYKRNKGYRNIRFSANYMTLANKTSFYAFRTIESSDSSITNRYYQSDYKTGDIRIGFEEIKGGGAGRFHIGADIILGYGQFYSEYRQNELMIDSIGVYRLDNNVEPIYTGSHSSDYFLTGIDVSFGFDWFLDEVFMVTLQLTPQFNYYLAISEKLADQFKQYNPIDNFIDFDLGCLDVMLVYKF